MIPALQKNDLVYICSPAKAIESAHIDYAMQLFEAKGYRVEVSKHALGQSSYFSGTEEERLEDFQNALNRPEVKAIVCSRGGYGCVHLLERIDWSKFENSPKWILGFSDVTYFHLDLLSKGFPSLHCTMPLDYQNNTTETINSMFQALEGEDIRLEGQVNDLQSKGSAKGAMIGGNLSILFALLSRHGLELYRDKILFIEDVGEHVYHYDRIFQAFKFAGIQKVIKGLVVGGFSNTRDTQTPFGKSLEEVIHHHFGEQSYPVGFGFPVGHQPENEAVICGAEAELLVRDDKVQLIISNPSA